MSAETVFSVLTPRGRGAVAVVALEGSRAAVAVDSFFRAKNRKVLEEQPLGRLVYGHWGDEDLIVCRREGERIEIHCHGGSQSVATISRDLVSAGCTKLPWREWVSDWHDCPVRAAAQISLAEAASTRTALILLDQFHGALGGEIEAIASLLRSISEPRAPTRSVGRLASGNPDLTLITHAPDASRPLRGARGSERLEALDRLEALLCTAELGKHLTRPWQVVIAGRPNVGKSSLINALVGYQRAIVFDQPGTTRDVVTASTVIDGWPVTLSDTAGLHAATDELEAAGIELARQRLATSDLVVWVLDSSEVYEPNALASGDGVINVESGLPEASRPLRGARGSGLALPEKQLLVINKVDQVASAVIPEFAIGTSAISGTGIDELLAAISQTLVPAVQPPGAAVLFTERQRVVVGNALRRCRRRDANGAAEVLSNLLNRAGRGE